MAIREQSPLPPHDWDDLIARVRGGCQDAGRALYEQIHNSLAMFIRKKFLGHWSILHQLFDSDDLEQMVWQRAFEKLLDDDRHFSQGEFASYILAITSNQFRTLWRDNVRLRKRSLAREEPLDMARHDSPEFGADPAEQAEAGDELRDFQESATEKGKEILLAIRVGMSVAEAADYCGVSNRTAQRVARDAWQRLEH
jgi:DNA-directed RNA polymerase specialized sigma24 family protein